MKNRKNYRKGRRIWETGLVKGTALWELLAPVPTGQASVTPPPPRKSTDVTANFKEVDFQRIVELTHHRSPYPISGYLTQVTKHGSPGENPHRWNPSIRSMR